jgi:membrane-associated phospholipid phosphatase
MTFLTDFADQAVMLPVVLAVAIVLAAMGWWRGALAWLCVIAVTFGGVLALKFGFLACRPVFGPWSIESPSGHTAAASVVAGSLAALLTGKRLAGLGVALLAAVVFGMSRLVLGFHSVPEVLIGAILGVAGATIVSHFAGPPPARRPVHVVVAVTLLVALLLHGVRLPAEAAIRHASRGALDFVPACRVQHHVRP